jgi:hypothetical protein
MANDATEAVFLLKEWNENIVRQLEIVANADKDTNFMVEDGEGNKIEIDKKDVKGLRFGAMLALDMIKKFPVTISQNEEE